MNLRTWQVLYNSLIALGIVLFIIGILVDERYVTVTMVCALAGLASVIGGLILQFFVWKCPHCDTHLPSRSPLAISHCPYCGNDLFQ